MKIDILKTHEIYIEKDFVEEVIFSPDKVEQGYKDRLIAQKKLDKERVLRVVYERPYLNNHSLSGEKAKI